MSALARDHRDALYAVALRICRDPGDANDLVQDTFERAFKNVDTLVDGTSARAWLVTILHHRFIDGCRRRARAPRTEPLEEHRLTGPPEPEPEPSWTRVTPEQLTAAVAALPEEFRRTFELHELESRSYAEIAEILGIAKATVGTRLIRARKRLKELLAAKQGAP